MNGYTEINRLAYRRALGNFATGVTVVAARDRQGRYVGVTANSFNSVSMEPPLVLWSLDRNALSLSSFEQADHFAINVLAADQARLSEHFASRGEGDKFKTAEFTEGAGGAPILTGCAAHFLCRKTFTYDGGDHLIFVGEVLEFQDHGRPGLVFYRGSYTVPGAVDDGLRAPRYHGETEFLDEYLDYLLSHAAASFQSQFALTLGRLGVSTREWRVLCSLGNNSDGMDAGQIAAVTLTPAERNAGTLHDMENKGWVMRSASGDGSVFRLTAEGSERLVPILAAAKAHEAAAFGDFSAAEARQLKDMLKALISGSAAVPRPGES